jgi:hypothetical protein
MSVGYWLLVIGAGLLLWLIIKWLFLNPAERADKARLDESFKKQARKRNGKVVLDRRTPALRIPHKTLEIELSFREDNVDLFNEYTYARFRIEGLPDKGLKILHLDKNFLAKPIALGARLDVSDERFSEKFAITGNDTSFANSLLTEEIRNKLMQVCPHVKFGRRTDAAPLDRERGWLTVFIPGFLIDDEVFDGLIETAVLFGDRLELLKGQG